MADYSKYFSNGRVERSKIAIDVADGRIDPADICRDKVIREAFIGDKFNRKKPKSLWNKDYLNELTYMSVAECFNEDYLKYLYEVGTTVKRKKSKIIIAVAGITLAVAIIIICFILIRKFILKPNELKITLALIHITLKGLKL